jgi:hypothetical protein
LPTRRSRVRCALLPRLQRRAAAHVLGWHRQPRSCCWHVPEQHSSAPMPNRHQQCCRWRKHLVLR